MTELEKMHTPHYVQKVLPRQELFTELEMDVP